MAVDDPLARFGPATRTWFRAAFVAPTAVQAETWRTVREGGHALVVAPTGSGKTLAAFLWSLDRLATAPTRADESTAPSGSGESAAPAGRQSATTRCRVLYVSPLKALAVDVERNLRRPLAGIAKAAAKLGLEPPRIRVGIRTGDTPASERRAFARTPPDILITTPESLFLLLTSAARASLLAVETVIVDEVHAVCATKRGAHLALSLERLDALLPRPAQRIGLSATVRPVDEVARFLTGSAPVRIVRPRTRKLVEVSVRVPVQDMTSLDEVPARDAGDGHDAGRARRASIWPAIEARVLDLIEAHRSTIVFTNSRRVAERLCARLNALAAERHATPPNAPAQGDRPPAEVMGQAGAAAGAPPVVARAHHGSVSRQERRLIEEVLKSGRLPAVIATSSLELGIDMGAVDLVIQIGAPPTVAAGLQRVGRSGHQVDAVSTGVMLPVHRGDLLSCAVVAERMREGSIEETRYPRHPLDVLAQQIVAMVAMDPWRLPALAALVRRAAPFAELPESALRSVLDLLTGRYPSTAFAELRPRLVWDRASDLLTARPGAQRLAVTSGGTIPNRGLFGVFLSGAARGGEGGSRAGVRVGELDEEMVFESRVGDVFMLGSTSWRIDDITADRVLVSPAPGAPARMPFWKGETPGRPIELGRAVGAALGRLARAEEVSDLPGLDAWAAENLLGYLSEQRAATRHLPDDRTIVFERFRDELGDWRLVLHCVLGARVNAPWALAVARRVSERYGVDGQVLPSDDGIVVRLPDVVDAPPGADLVLFDPDELSTIVEESVGSSALFAARFRECAARALLLPRRDPGRRQPLWQQRQRAAQLLAIAREFPDFPITLETARECLSDVYDVPGLTTIMREIAARRIRVVEVETARPSPFARSLLFGYVGAFLYDGDAPLAERRAAALALDPVMLSELLGRVDLRDLLDERVVAEASRALRRLTPDRAPRGVEDVAELLRVLGDLSEPELVARGADPGWLAELAKTGRAIEVVAAGEARWVAAEDAARYRDALGAGLPLGLPAAYLEPVADPLGDLIVRYARTSGPLGSREVADRFGLGIVIVQDALGRLASEGKVVDIGGEWCHPEVLRMLRNRSLAALRKEIEPVSPATLARFLPAWQELGQDAGRGPEALLAAIDRLRGAAIPASALERLVLPARVVDYTPAYLDELCASGEVLWAGSGALRDHDGWIRLTRADVAPQVLPDPAGATDDPLRRAVLAALEGGQALFFRGIADRVSDLLGQPVTERDLVAAIWDLVWAGAISGDTPAPLRAYLAGAGTRPASPPATASRRHGRLSFPGYGRGALAPPRSTPATVAGRWYRLPAPDPDPTARVATVVEALLERHGVLARGAVLADGAPGGFAAAYQVLRAAEERGLVRRGYFVEGLGAAQFALPGAVDRLRAVAEPRRDDAGPALVLAATDPANPFGAAVPWPDSAFAFSPDERESERPGVRHRPSRRPGAVVVLVRDKIALYVERGGRTVLSYTERPDSLAAAARALAEAVRSGALGPLSVERVDGAWVHAAPLRDALTAAGFRVTPRGLRLHG